MAAKRFHHSEFSSAEKLAGLKTGPVTVCIPTLDEAATISSIVTTIRRHLMEEVPLVDEILVIDSGSTDDTRTIAADSGARVFLSGEIALETGTHRGKGENLWKALHVAQGDIICYVDGDISNFHAGFITGLIGPLLTDPSIGYVKAHYERPLSNGNGIHPTGGGRVSEILVRPLLSLFYPELTEIFQPLSGEYAARRSLLETLAFPTGYGVEIAHLIDLSSSGRFDLISQTDLDQRVHRNRTDEELGRMAFAILRTILSRLERDGKIRVTDALPILHRSWNHVDGEPVEIVTSLPEYERPSVSSLR